MASAFQGRYRAPLIRVSGHVEDAAGDDGAGTPPGRPEVLADVLQNGDPCGSLGTGMRIIASPSGEHPFVHCTTLDQLNAKSS